MAVLYHLFHFACLSPPTSRIALRLGSKTNRMRISLCPAEPGRSSFIDLTRRDPLILPTSGRLRFGPCSFNISNAARTCILDSRSSEFSQSLTSSSSMVYISINIPQEVYLHQFASCEDTLQPTHHTHLRRGSRGATPRPLRIPEHQSKALEPSCGVNPYRSSRHKRRKRTSRCAPVREPWHRLWRCFHGSRTCSHCGPAVFSHSARRWRAPRGVASAHPRWATAGERSSLSRSHPSNFLLDRPATPD